MSLVSIIDWARVVIFVIGLIIVTKITTVSLKHYLDAKRVGYDPYVLRITFLNCLLRVLGMLMILAVAILAVTFGDHFPYWAIITAKVLYTLLGVMMTVIGWNIHRQQEHTR